MEEELAEPVENNKKKVIALLLLISSIICFILILKMPSQGKKRLTSLGEADTLITRELRAFNIKKQQIRIKNIHINKKFIRKVYIVDLPARFSKTFLHAELNKRLYPYDVQDPAIVHLPEGNMDIQLAYGGDIIRTIKLVSDTAIKYRRYPASVLAYFNRKPSEEVVKSIEDLGSRLPVVLKVSNVSQGKDWYNSIKAMKTHVIFWFGNGEANQNSTNKVDWHLNEQLQTLGKVFRNPTVLVNPSADEQTRTLIDKDSQHFKINYVNAKNAILVTTDEGQIHFERQLQRFMRLAEQNERPIMLINATDESFQWLKNSIQRFKKSGLTLVPPITDHQ